MRTLKHFLVVCSWALSVALPSAAMAEDDHGTPPARPDVMMTPQNADAFKMQHLQCCVCIYDGEAAESAVFSQKCQTMSKKGCWGGGTETVSKNRFSSGQTFNPAIAKMCTDVRIMYSGHNLASYADLFHTISRNQFPNMTTYKEDNLGCQTLGGFCSNDPESAMDMPRAMNNVRESLRPGSVFEIKGNQCNAAIEGGAHPTTCTPTSIKITSESVEINWGSCWPVGSECFAQKPYESWMCERSPGMPVRQTCCGAKKKNANINDVTPGRWTFGVCAGG